MTLAFQDTTKSRFSQAALDAFFTKPIINTTEFMRLSGIARRGTANQLLTYLVEAKHIMLLHQGGGREASTYVFPELLNIAEGGQVFRL